MAQIPGYACDIFISYTHDDNHAPRGMPGWVDTFHESLESWLVKRRGLSELRIWRDTTRMEGNTVFNEAIKSAVNTAALFFALQSRNYRTSAYCQDELRWFDQCNKDSPGGLRVGDRLRIFNILLNNIPYQQWSPALSQTSGFPMHDAKTNAELGDFTSINDERFEKQLRAIVDAVESIVQAFPRHQPEPVRGEAEHNSIHIFMADAADTLQAFRDRLIAEARGQDARLVADIPPPMESAQHAVTVKQALAQAQFSVHVLDQWPGRRIVDNAQTTYPREQLTLALESPTPQLIWVSDQLDIAAVEDETQRHVLENLVNGARETRQYECVSGTQSAFTQVLLQKITALQNHSTNGAMSRTFLVDTHQKDQRYAFKLADYLAQNGVDVDFNLESFDPTLSLTKFEQAVRQVRNLIILCGKVGSAWVHGRIKKAFTTTAEQFDSENTVTLENIWVYLMPASGGRVELPKFPPLIRITLLDNSHTEAIDPQVISRLLEPDGTGGRP